MAQAVRPRGPVTGTAVASEKRKRKPFLADLWSTAVGKKYAMALSGIAMMGFVFFHMVGNLKAYFGEEDLNHYAEFLRDLLYPIAPEGWVLWIMRLGLIAAVVVHIVAAMQLTVMNRHARPVKYQSPRDYQVASFASRSMRLTGIVVAAFIVFHLADLTFGWANTWGADGEFDRHEVYANLARSLDRWPVALFYIAANILLGIHLLHGGWSLFQSMGWNNPRFNAWRRAFAAGFAAVIVVGNVSIPIAVLAGVIES